MLKTLIILSIILILGSLATVFFVVPSASFDRNIVYIHVPSAFAAIMCFGILFVSSLMYLRTGSDIYDRVSFSAAECGLIFALALNITGSIFAKVQWNIWWSPSPRLISSAVMLMLLAVYLMLRASSGSSKKIIAVFGIIASIDIPIILITARATRDIHQPTIGFENPYQVTAFVGMIIGVCMFAVCLIIIRVRILKLNEKLKLKITENL